MKNILAAFIFFTRLPFWRITTVDKEYFKNVVTYWPYAGIITGGIGACVMICASFVFPVYISVILGIISRILITGALHEDGLADFFDGFGGGRSKESILRIMKDSYIGSYGVIGLVLYFTLIISILSSLPVKYSAILFFCGDILCKSISSLIVNILPYARTEEESKNKLIYKKILVVRLLVTNILVCSMLYIVYSMLLPVYMSLAIIAPVAVFMIFVIYIKNKIDGYTGDCCGAVFLLCELVFFLISLGIYSWL